MKSNPFSLHEKTILVTGASSGIGRSVAIECSRLGARVIINGRNEERLNETFTALTGINHKKIPGDLNVVDQMDHLVKELPLVDGIVHAAGIIITLPFQFTTREKLEDIFSINFVSPTLLSKEIVKQKKIGRGGAFVWVSSISGQFCSSPGHSLYSSTKSAINGLVKGMAIDLAKKGIRVNSINPGQIETNLFTEGVISKEQMMEEEKKYPLKRFGRPEEVAYACVYLLSDASAWVTGTHLVIDGGFTLL